MANTIKIKRGTGNPGSNLSAYELGWDTSTNSLYIGNGTDSTLIANAFASYLSIDHSTGLTTVTNNFAVNGNTTLGNAATDTTTIRGVVTISDSTKLTHIQGTLNVDQAAEFLSSITVDGNSTLGSATTAVNTIRGTVNISDPSLITTIKGDLTTNGATTLGTTLDVTGVTTLRNKLDVVGNVEIGALGNPVVTINATTGNIVTSGDMFVQNLTVHGSTTTVESTTVTVADPIFTLGTSTVQDFKDRGIEFKYNNGTTAKDGFFGWHASTNSFVFIPDATNTSEVFSGNFGNFTIGEIYQPQTSGVYAANGTIVNASANWNAAVKSLGISGGTGGITSGTQYDLLQADANGVFQPTKTISASSGITIDCGSY